MTSSEEDPTSIINTEEQLELQRNVKIMNSCKGPVPRNLCQLNQMLSQAEVFDPISIREFRPSDHRRSYDLIELLLNAGLSVKCVHNIIHIDRKKQSLHFLQRFFGRKHDRRYYKEMCP